jgi:LuxR family maltose regulon positive regulatory protein
VAGDQAGALALLDEAERLYVADFYPRIRPIAALRARIWIGQGRLREARGWMRAEGLSADDGLDYVRTFEHVTVARLLLAEARHGRSGESLLAATALLDRLLEAAVSGGLIGAAVEILLLQALAIQTRGDVEAALAPLQRALALAEPEGYVRIFLDEGEPMARLLGALRDRLGSPSYVEELLTGFGRGAKRPALVQGLVEPLSGRELEVLRLLGSDLDGPGIARELVVSLSTIRSHTKAIYAKLGVTSRRAAVGRAEELNLLSRADLQPHRLPENA